MANENSRISELQSVLRKSDNTSTVNLGNILSPDPIGSPETVSVTSATAVGFASIPVGAIGAIVQFDQPVRVSLSGTPTTTSGLLINGGQPVYLESAAELSGFKAIAVSATSTGFVEYRG